VAQEFLPKQLGGECEVDHEGWLRTCAEVAASRNGELVTMSSSQPSTPAAEHRRRAQPTLEQLETLPTTRTADSSKNDTLPNGLTRLVLPARQPEEGQEEEEEEEEEVMHPVVLPNGGSNGLREPDRCSSGLSDDGERGDAATDDDDSQGMTLAE